MKATAVSLVPYVHNNTILMLSSSKVIGKEHLMPRFWVLTDHSRAQIVLVIRGQFISSPLSFPLGSSQQTARK